MISAPIQKADSCNGPVLNERKRQAAVFPEALTWCKRFVRISAPVPLARLISGLLILTPFFFSCQPEKRVGNTEALTREMKSMKIKRVTPNQLSGILHELGRKVAVNATSSFQTALEHGKGDSLCLPSATTQLFDGLRKNYGIEIRLVYAADTLQPGMPSKEKEVLSAYAYNVAHRLPLNDNLQMLNDTLALYHAPLPPDHPVFKKCAPATQSAFVVWHILFNTKEVIRRLDPKQLNP